MCADHATALQADEEVDNRLAWGQVGTNGFRARASDRGFRALPMVVSWYISLLDGTGTVERNLGAIKKYLQQHTGPMDEVGQDVWDWLDTFCDGPREEADVGRPRAGGVSPAAGGVSPARGCVRGGLDLTNFSRGCAELWVQTHGRRHALYNTLKNRKKKPLPTGTDAAVRRNQIKGIAALADRAGVVGRGAAQNFESLFGGVVGDHTGAPPVAEGKLMKKFKTLTKNKSEARQREAQFRLAGICPYPRPELRRGGLFRPPARHTPLRVSLVGGVSPILDAATDPLPPCRYVRRFQSATASWGAVLAARVVVVDSVDFIGCRPRSY